MKNLITMVSGVVCLLSLVTLASLGGPTNPFGPTPAGFAIIILTPLAAILFIIGVISASSSPRDYRSWVIFCCSLPMLTAVALEMSYPSSRRAEDRRLKRERMLSDWRNLGARVNPLLREYYRLYPVRFRFLHGDDEADIGEFEDFVSSRGIALVHGKIRDPWGDPVHYVVDHDKDLVLRARGLNYGVGTQIPEQVAVGLLLDDPNRVVVAYNDEWSLENGFIPKK